MGRKPGCGAARSPAAAAPGSQASGGLSSLSEAELKTLQARKIFFGGEGEKITIMTVIRIPTCIVPIPKLPPNSPKAAPQPLKENQCLGNCLSWLCGCAVSAATAISKPPASQMARLFSSVAVQELKPAVVSLFSWVAGKELKVPDITMKEWELFGDLLYLPNAYMIYDVEG